MANQLPNEPFWRRKSLVEMTTEEWESLCDGCARCCLIKLEDTDSGEISYTDISCRLLDPGVCRCTQYGARNRLVPDCVQLSPDRIADLGWMPSTCANRLIADGHDLPWWHKLVSGDPDTVHRAGISVRDRVIPEQRGDDPEDRIVRWPE